MSENKKNESAEQKKGILVLKSKATSLKTAENFLNNRNWVVVSVTDIKSAIKEILSGKYSYILLTVEHSNPKVVKLPPVISQTLGTPVIMFSEGTSPRGGLLLNESPVPYKLFPPVSGPSIERMFLKIERDREKEKEAKNNPSVIVKAAGDPDAVKMTASGSVRAGNTITFESNKKAHEAFAKFFEGENEEASGGANFVPHSGSLGSSTSQNKSSSVTYMPESYGYDAKGFHVHRSNIYNPQSAHIARPTSSSHSGLSPSGSTSLIPELSEDVLNYLNDQTQKSAPNIQAPHSSEIKAPQITKEEGANGLHPNFEGLNRKGDHLMHPQTGPTSAPQYHHKPSFGENSENNQNSAEGITLKPKVSANIYSDGANILTFKNDENSSFLIKGSKHALDKSTIIKDDVQVKQLKKCRRIGCFKIDSAKFKGYVIIAMAEGDRVDSNLNQNLQKYLYEYLKSCSIDVDMKDFAALSIQEVDFEDWSIQEADFLMKSVHEGNEVALAFFPQTGVEAPLELSADAKMVKLSLDEIDTDKPLPFDFYLYLPVNKKYVRYVQKNGKLYESQKERLAKKGQQNVHVRKEAVDDISRYRTESFLDKKVKAYNRKKKAV